MIKDGIFKVLGDDGSTRDADVFERMEKPAYVIYTQCRRCVPDSGHLYRKYLLSDTMIRLELFRGFPFWKVSELLRCKDWRVLEKQCAGNSVVYYIGIL